LLNLLIVCSIFVSYRHTLNIYSQKQRWKLLLLVAAIAIGALSLWYTQQLVSKLQIEEKKKMELWAEATQRLATMDINEGTYDLGFISNVISSNTTIPVILADDKGNVNSFLNLDSAKALTQPNYLKEQIAEMKQQHEPIEIVINASLKNFLYYKDSILLSKLRYYPFFQLGVISLFLLVSYLAFSNSRKAEQNQVWVGMAKETAHQLGTPLSSLMAWLELMKLKGGNEEYTAEIEKDIHRLQTITERFSKIGSAPSLNKEKIFTVLEDVVNYHRKRTSEKVVFQLTAADADAAAPINVPLFEWVIENLVKNAIDAMDGDGSINVHITDQQQFVYIDITDSGKGIAKNAFKTIFKPGFTTKKRGWGLGLSLSKRIVEDYHGGELFVKHSELKKGTTFRIVLNKQT
jgi:signal transduction histidine kinase